MRVISIDGRVLEYRLERRGEATVLILHGGHMSARCRFGEETLRTTRCWWPLGPDTAERLLALGPRLQSSSFVWPVCAVG